MATSMIFDKYVIREATPDDYQSVINIADDLYGGEDYVPPLYYFFIQSKRYKMLVGDDDGQLFSLILADFDESNPTLFTSMAHRISKSKQGRGIFRQFEAACHRLLRSQFPQLSHWLSVTDEKYMKPGGYSPLYRMHHIKCRTTITMICRGISAFTHASKSCPSVQSLSYQQAVEELNNGQQLENFFRRFCWEYLVAMIGNYAPVNINSKSGLRRAFASASSVLITRGHSSLEDENNGSIDRNQSDGNVTSLSFAHAQLNNSGVCYHISFYGDDPYLAALHEVEHCRHLSTVAKGDIGIRLLIPFDIDKDKFRATVDPVIGQHVMLSDGPYVLAKLPVISPKIV